MVLGDQRVETGCSIYRRGKSKIFVCFFWIRVSVSL
uniref:Uncharacterized protein n=1 Tax=Manihot esculenta TaxID=3983 RepID=A0A2C9W3G5_MANES